MEKIAIEGHVTEKWLLSMPNTIMHQQQVGGTWKLSLYLEKNPVQQNTVT